MRTLVLRCYQVTAISDLLSESGEIPAYIFKLFEDLNYWSGSWDRAYDISLWRPALY